MIRARKAAAPPDPFGFTDALRKSVDLDKQAIAGYAAVRDAVARGDDPAGLCAACPPDRTCVKPPTITKAEVDEQFRRAADRDMATITADRTKVPMASIMTVLVAGAKDIRSVVCPVFALRLQSGSGRKIADETKTLMQAWDDDA